MGFHGGSDGKASACNAGATGDAGSIPGSGRSPVEGLGNPLQYSCLENPMDRGAWWATVHGVTKSWTRMKRLSMHALPAVQETQVQSLGREDPLEMEVANHSSIPVLENPRDRGAYRPWVHKRRTRLSD